MRKFVLQLASLAVIALTVPALAQTDGWEKGSAYNKNFDAKTTVTISGKLTKIDRDNHPMPGMGPGLAAVVKTDKGEDVTIQVGPIWFTSYFKHKWDVKVGDSVQVTGSKVTIGGKPVIMVMKGQKDKLAMAVRNKTGKPVWDLEVEDF